MVPKDLDTLIEKYLDGKCTPAERAMVESLYASLGDQTEESKPGIALGADGARARRILSKVETHVKGIDASDDHRSYPWRYAGIAASLVFMLAAGYYFIAPPAHENTAATKEVVRAFTVVENTTAQRKRVILPDGSIVEMSPQSEIRYATDNNGTARELSLKGEAYFDVAHDLSRPFYVYAGNVVTKVLGTSFIIRARDEDEQVTVSVKTGKVSVYSRTTAHKKTVLTPNQEAVYDNATDLVATQEARVRRATEEEAPSAEMHFEETPIPHVLETLSKSYSIDIVFDQTALSGCVLTSSFYEEGLYDRIDVICTAIGATYSITDARIFIESKGCNLKLE